MFTFLNEGSFKNCIRNPFYSSYVKKKQFKKVKTEVNKTRNKPCAHTLLVKCKPNLVKLTQHAGKNVWVNSSITRSKSHYQVHIWNTQTNSWWLWSLHHVVITTLGLFCSGQAKSYCIVRWKTSVSFLCQHANSLPQAHGKTQVWILSLTQALFNLNVREEKKRNTSKLCCGT